MESSSSNIASSSAPGPSTESEPSVVTACTSGPSCSSLDTTTHSNNTQRKRKADLLVTSYVNIILFLHKILCILCLLEGCRFVWIYIFVKYKDNQMILL